MCHEPGPESILNKFFFVKEPAQCGHGFGCPEDVRDASSNPTLAPKLKNQRPASPQGWSTLGCSAGQRRGNNWATASPGLGFRRLCRFVLSRLSNQSPALARGNISPGPLHHYQQAVAEADQEKHVNEQPRQPGKVSGEMQLA